VVTAGDPTGRRRPASRPCLVEVPPSLERHEPLHERRTLRVLARSLVGFRGPDERRSRAGNQFERIVRLKQRLAAGVDARRETRIAVDVGTEVPSLTALPPLLLRRPRTSNDLSSRRQHSARVTRKALHMAATLSTVIGVTPHYRMPSTAMAIPSRFLQTVPAAARLGFASHQRRPEDVFVECYCRPPGPALR
jgi:hypothetical protein